MQWESYPAAELDGRRYGMKAASFEALEDLPSRTDERLELAVGAPADVRARIEAAGWATIDPRPVTRDPEAYGRYLRDSKGEIGIAKHGYVTTSSGWFSERSLAYMAHGRPVVLQDTGFSRWLPTGEGVLAFSTAEEAAAGLDAAASDYERHCGAARAVVAEHFDGRAVVEALLDRTVAAGALPHT
jgi:glycosyltransferase involved in cell wall biosynthesis